MPKTGRTAGEWRATLLRWATSSAAPSRGEYPPAGSRWTDELLRVLNCPYKGKPSSSKPFRPPFFLQDAVCSCGYHSVKLPHASSSAPKSSSSSTGGMASSGGSSSSTYPSSSPPGICIQLLNSSKPRWVFFAVAFVFLASHCCVCETVPFAMDKLVHEQEPSQFEHVSETHMMMRICFGSKPPYTFYAVAVAKSVLKSCQVYQQRGQFIFFKFLADSLAERQEEVCNKTLDELNYLRRVGDESLSLGVGTLVLSLAKPLKYFKEAPQASIIVVREANNSVQSDFVWANEQFQLVTFLTPRFGGKSGTRYFVAFNRGILNVGSGILNMGNGARLSVDALQSASQAQEDEENRLKFDLAKQELNLLMNASKRKEKGKFLRVMLPKNLELFSGVTHAPIHKFHILTAVDKEEAAWSKMTTHMLTVQGNHEKKAFLPIDATSLFPGQALPRSITETRLDDFVQTRTKRDLLQTNPAPHHAELKLLAEVVKKKMSNPTVEYEMEFVEVGFGVGLRGLRNIALPFYPYGYILQALPRAKFEKDQAAWNRLPTLLVQIPGWLESNDSSFYIPFDTSNSQRRQASGGATAGLPSSSQETARGAAIQGSPDPEIVPLNSLRFRECSVVEPYEVDGLIMTQLQGPFPEELSTNVFVYPNGMELRKSICQGSIPQLLVRRGNQVFYFDLDTHPGDRNKVMEEESYLATLDKDEMAEYYRFIDGILKNASTDLVHGKLPKSFSTNALKVS